MPGGSDGPQIVDTVGYHGSNTLIPVMRALRKTVGSASARNPVMTHVWAPRHAMRMAGAPVRTIAAAASRNDWFRFS